MGFTLTLLFSADIAAVDSLVRRSCRAFGLAPVFELLIAIVHAVIPPSGLVADRAHWNHEHSTTQYSHGLEDGQLEQPPGHDPNLIAFQGRLSLVHQAGSVTVQLCSLRWNHRAKASSNRMLRRVFSRATSSRAWVCRCPQPTLRRCRVIPGHSEMLSKDL